ncbi:MAG: UDP-N-acetylmuramoylalanine--D-glutamate ligase, partial [Pseudomonadota bacterium]
CAFLDHHHAVVLGGPVDFEAEIKMKYLQGQHILILGLGSSGLAMARWCAERGADITVADTREAPANLQVLNTELPEVQFKSGPFAANLIEGTSVRAVFASPGLAPIETLPVIEAAKAMGLWVGGELSLFVQALENLKATRDYAPQVLAITGTNGKTTVTALTGQLIERAGKTVKVAGNIGPTLLDTLRLSMATELPEVWVLELSSFQLDNAGPFEPSAATVLNITQDHLDWHGNMAAYAAAKEKIFGASSLMVLNRDDARVMAMLPEPVRAKLQKPVVRVHVSYGAEMPQRPGDFGLETVNGMTWLVRALEADETRRLRKGEVEEIHIQRLMPADALRIRGRHNAMLFGLREYKGEPHRVEPVAIVNEVEYFDDSKGTNVGATVAALLGLGAERRVVVILGGEGKGQDFSPLAEPVARYARAVVLIGRDAPLIREEIKACGVPMIDASTLPEAVNAAKDIAQAGDAVLLSPACASFDMFRDYPHRAQVFCQAVAEIAEAAGQSMEAAL